MRRAQEARDLAGELHHVVQHVRQCHRCGQAPALRHRRAQDRAVAGRIVAVVAQELEVPLQRVAPAHRRERSRVVVRHRVVHAADDRHAVHHPRCVRQVFADPHPGHARRDRAERAAHLRRSPRLHVDRVDVAGSAIIEQQDARPDRCRPGSSRRHQPLGLGPQQPRQRKAQRPKAADPKHLPPVHDLILCPWCRALACLSEASVASGRVINDQ